MQTVKCHGGDHGHLRYNELTVAQARSKEIKYNQLTKRTSFFRTSAEYKVPFNKRGKKNIFKPSRSLVSKVVVLSGSFAYTIGSLTSPAALLMLALLCPLIPPGINRLCACKIIRARIQLAGETIRRVNNSPQWCVMNLKWESEAFVDAQESKAYQIKLDKCAPNETSQSF